MTTLAVMEQLRLAARGELQALLGGVSATRIVQITAHPKFPPPRAELKVGNIWDLDDVDRWASEVGRTLDYDALEALQEDMRAQAKAREQAAAERVAEQRRRAAGGQ
jgi:hypothetical protein